MPASAPGVQFLGRTGESELHAWYEAADVFVHPTLYEGSSLVTLEAMAHRRPCVVTRAGGLPDKVANGVNGWIVAPGIPPPWRRRSAAPSRIPTARDHGPGGPLDRGA